MSNTRNTQFIENRLDEAYDWFLTTYPGKEDIAEEWISRNFKDCITPTDYEERLETIKKSKHEQDEKWGANLEHWDE